MGVLEMTSEKQPQDCELCPMKEEEIQALVSRLRTAEEAISILEEQCRIRMETINHTIAIAADFKAQRDKCMDMKAEEVEELVRVEVRRAFNMVDMGKLSGELTDLCVAKEKEGEEIQRGQ